MLLQRIITGLILAAVAIAAVFLLPSLYFSLFVAIIVLLGAWEWLKLTDVDSALKRVGFYLLLIVPMLGIQFWTNLLELGSEALDWPELKEYSGMLEWMVILPVLFWVLTMLLLRKLPEQMLQLQLKPGYKASIGWLVLLSAWMFVEKLRAYYGSEMIFYFFVLISVADVAAFFTGKKFGKDPLAPVISPGKTVQGMYGALASAALCAVALSLYFGFPFMIATDFMLLSVLTVLVSIYGDLFFSLVKRQKGVKDSGFIFPGHGGVLDRIDSIIAAAPFFYAGILLIGRSVYA